MEYYEKLRPNTDIEYCDCSEISSILLVYTLTDNPIHCYKCKGTIDPEKLKLTSDEVYRIGTWHNVFSSLYLLWLDSGEYEAWAKEQLLNKNGQVNIQGMDVAKILSNRWPTYYWWFYDSDDPIPNKCPNCGAELDDDNRHGHGKCTKCLVVI